MHPVVNTLDDADSRIKSLERQVRTLRQELAAKERSGAPAPASGAANATASPGAVAAAEMPSSAAEAGTHADPDHMATRLQTQLHHNKQLQDDTQLLGKCATHDLPRNPEPLRLL